MRFVAVPLPQPPSGIQTVPLSLWDLEKNGTVRITLWVIVPTIDWYLCVYLFIISRMKSFLACGWTIAYHVITRWTSYPRKPSIVDFESRFLRVAMTTSVESFSWESFFFQGSPAQVPARIKWQHAPYVRWWVNSGLQETLTSQWSQYTACECVHNIDCSRSCIQTRVLACMYM